MLKLEDNQQLLTAKLHNYRLIFEQYVEIGGQPAAPNSHNYTTTGRFCHTRAPSWILSQAENLASVSLQDGATKWYYFLVWTTHPPNHRISLKSTLDFQQSRKSGSFYVVRCPHPIDKVCAVSPPQQSMCGVPTLQVYDFPRTQLLPPQKSMCSVPLPPI